MVARNREAEVQLDAITVVDGQIADLVVVRDLASQVEMGAVEGDQKGRRAVLRSTPMRRRSKELRLVAELDLGGIPPFGEVAVNGHPASADGQFAIWPLRRHTGAQGQDHERDEGAAHARG